MVNGIGVINCWIYSLSVLQLKCSYQLLESESYHAELSSLGWWLFILPYLFSRKLIYMAMLDRGGMFIETGYSSYIGRLTKWHPYKHCQPYFIFLQFPFWMTPDLSILNHTDYPVSWFITYDVSWCYVSCVTIKLLNVLKGW